MRFFLVTHSTQTERKPRRDIHVCECIWMYANLNSRTSAMVLIKFEIHRIYTIMEPSMGRGV